MRTKFKISFCTVCMNRLHHLKETLHKNIQDNLNYIDSEFVLLDYNSKDELEKWVKNHMKEYIRIGKLKYFKTTEPQSFHHSHAKNVVSKCATGDIICNVDADNFLGKNFADYINSEFGKNRAIYLSVSKGFGPRDCIGRICAMKEDFYKLMGYDETIVGYGFEDLDLINRLDMLKLSKVEISDSKFLNAISHEDALRLKFEKNSVNIQEVYIRFIDYKSSIILYLFDNLTYKIGVVLVNELVNSQRLNNLFDGKKQFEYKNSLLNDKWFEGEWEKQNNIINFSNREITNDKKDSLSSPIVIGEFTKIENVETIVIVKMFYSQISNRIIMENNRKEGITAANKNGFGKAQLTKNFKEIIIF